MIETELRIRHDRLARVLCLAEFEVTDAIMDGDFSRTDRAEHFTNEITRGGKSYFRVSEAGVRAIACILGKRCDHQMLEDVLEEFSEARRAHANAAFLI